MKTSHETEVQLQLIIWLNQLADDAAKRNLLGDALRLRQALNVIAQIRLEHCDLRKGEFRNKLSIEMGDLAKSISPRLLSNPVLHLETIWMKTVETHLP